MVLKFDSYDVDIQDLPKLIEYFTIKAKGKGLCSTIARMAFKGTIYLI